jgi:hypothetical protein
MLQNASSTMLKRIRIFAKTGFSKSTLTILAISAALTFCCLRFVLGSRYELTFSGDREQLVDRWTGNFFRPDVDTERWQEVSP